MGNSITKQTTELHEYHEQIYDRLMKFTKIYNNFFNTMKELNDGESIFANTEAINTLSYATDIQARKHAYTVPYVERTSYIILDTMFINEKIDKLDAMILFAKKPLIEDEVPSIVTETSPGDSTYEAPEINNNMKQSEIHKIWCDLLKTFLTIYDRKIEFFEKETKFIIDSFKIAITMDDMAGDDSDDGIAQVPPQVNIPPPPPYTKIEE